MLRVAKRGILFKVYRGVPLTFAMTPLAARGCAVGNAGGCWTERFSPPTSLRKTPQHPPEVPRCPAGCPSLSCRNSLVVPTEVASPRRSATLRCLKTRTRSRVVVAPWGSPVAMPLASPGRRPMLLGAPACRKNPSGDHWVSVENVP